VTGSLRAVKGHGTENDFIVLPDLDDARPLSAALVRALTDRRAGIGADGVLRVVRTALAAEPDVRAQAPLAPFFMDYRNADGSVAEMCGNGVRVFARYLRECGLVGGAFRVATRGGPKAVDFVDDEISVDMGRPVILDRKPIVSAPGMPMGLAGLAVTIPNPHVVVELASTSELDRLDLSSAPDVTAPLPDGQNVEFVVRTGLQSVRMRVHERGVGETRSCGTGICAAVAAMAADDQTGEWVVDVPGGRCRVGWTATGSMLLTGPAVLVAELEIAASWLDAHS
jgi:diaminopimelate epimerase